MHGLCQKKRWFEKRALKFKADAAFSVLAKMVKSITPSRKKTQVSLPVTYVRSNIGNLFLCFLLLCFLLSARILFVVIYHLNISFIRSKRTPCLTYTFCLRLRSLKLTFFPGYILMLPILSITRFCLCAFLLRPSSINSAFSV